MHTKEQEETQYNVVINDEEQYSIWPLAKEMPLGWQSVGVQGIKTDCLSYIKKVWTDMRPLSLRKQMEELKQTSHLEIEIEDQPFDTISPTVKFLSKGKHPVAIYPIPTSLERLKSYLNDRFIHVNFLDTQGETCLGMNIDAMDKAAANLESGQGNLHLEGELVLDFVKVRCFVDVDVSSMKGVGYLQIKEPSCLSS